MGKQTKESLLSDQEQEALSQAHKLLEMFQSKGYQEVLKPLLLAKLNQAFPNPLEAKDEKEFTYRALVTSAMKQVIGEILQLEEQKESEIAYYKKKEKGELEKDKFKI